MGGDAGVHSTVGMFIAFQQLGLRLGGCYDGVRMLLG